MLYAASKAGVINLSKSMALSTDNKVLCSRLSSSVSTLIKNGIIV